MPQFFYKKHPSVLDVEVLTLCDYAFLADGKLNVNQMFDSLYSKEFPFKYSCYAAGKVIFNNSSGLNHLLELKLHSKNHLTSFGESNIVLNEGIQEYPRNLNFVAKLENLEVFEPGELFLELLIDKVTARIIFVYSINQPAQ